MNFSREEALFALALEKPAAKRAALRTIKVVKPANCFSESISNILTQMRIQTRSRHLMVYQLRGSAFGIGVIALLLILQEISSAADEDFTSRVDRVLAETPLIDGHNDLPDQIRDRFNRSLAAIDLQSNTSKTLSTNAAVPLMTDIPRLRAGRMGAQFWSV